MANFWFSISGLVQSLANAWAQQLGTIGNQKTIYFEDFNRKILFEFEEPNFGASAPALSTDILLL